MVIEEIKYGWKTSGVVEKVYVNGFNSEINYKKNITCLFI